MEVCSRFSSVLLSSLPVVMKSSDVWFNNLLAMPFPGCLSCVSQRESFLLNFCLLGLWGLVNNAGISTFGEVEFTSMDTYMEVAEVNLWGTVRTTKAFLPLIRRSKGE